MSIFFSVTYKIVIYLQIALKSGKTITVNIGLHVPRSIYSIDIKTKMDSGVNFKSAFDMVFKQTIMHDMDFPANELINQKFSKQKINQPTVQTLDIEDLQTKQYVRKLKAETISLLISSLIQQEENVITTSLVVVKSGQKYEIIDGNHRHAAMMQVRLRDPSKFARVPCIVYEDNNIDRALFALKCNMLSTNSLELTDFERVCVVRNILNENPHNKEEQYQKIYKYLNLTNVCMIMIY